VLATGDDRRRASPAETAPRLELTGPITLALTAVGLFAAALAYAAGALGQFPIVGPEATSIFARIGPALSYATPIFLAALVLVGHAIADRRGALALGGGLLLNLGATVAYVFWAPGVDLSLDPVGWIRMAQLNAAVTSAFALAWLLVAARSNRT